MVNKYIIMKLSSSIRWVPLALSLLACETQLPAASRPAKDLCAEQRQVFVECMDDLFHRTNCPGSEALIEGARSDRGIEGDVGLDTPVQGDLGLGVDSGEVDLGVINCLDIEAQVKICNKEYMDLLKCEVNMPDAGVDLGIDVSIDMGNNNNQ